jgi:hypothetical protein
MKFESTKEEAKDASLTTAALAHVDERSATGREVDRPSFHPGSGGIDRPPADDESRPTLVAGDEARRISEAHGRNGSEADAAADRASRFSSTATTSSLRTAEEDEKATPLFSEQEAKGFFARWDSLQVGFIDEPRHAVEQADNLVAGAMKRLAEIFADERAHLEGQWDRGGNVSTEDLRIAMQRYRSFFRRLLAV